MSGRLGYALAAAAVFLVEVAIAVFAHDAIVRPYAGDALAVVLVYLGLRAVTRLGVNPAAALALAIAFAVEAGQYFGIVDRLGLRGVPWAALVLGIGFDPRDFLAYTAGALLVLAAEAWRTRTP
ncbi:MAG: DUF2809 domain-containing protein [Pseudomonadota bacterium]